MVTAIVMIICVIQFGETYPMGMGFWTLYTVLDTDGV